MATPHYLLIIKLPQQMNKKNFIVSLLVLCTSFQLFGQISKDRMKFAQNLNIRRANHEAANPHAAGFLQVPFGEINYKGVEAVSTKFMLDAYPKEDPHLVMGLFETLGLDSVVFRKFMFQAFLATNGDKHLTVGLLNALCDNLSVSQRIFNFYQPKFANQIPKQTVQEDDAATEEPSKTFDIPIKDSKDGFKNRGLKSISFSTNTVQFYKGGQYGVDNNTNWKIFISADLIKLVSPYRDGNMVDEYTVIESKYDSEHQYWEFSTGTLGEEHSLYHNKTIIKNIFHLSYDSTGVGYVLSMKSVDKSESLVFTNQLNVIKSE